MADQNSDEGQNPGSSSNNNNANNKSGSTPSFLSPVGETSRNYSVVLDEDDLLDLSPITPSMLSSGAHRPLHRVDHNHRNPSSPARSNDRFWESESTERYTFDFNDSTAENDTPLLGYNYRHDDDDSHHQHRRLHDDDDDDDDDDHYHHDNHHPLFHDHNRHHNANHPHRDINARPKLNGLNYLNVITLVLNVFTSYFIGVRGLFGVLTPRRDIFIKYETLVTPADYAYWLWAPILVFEFIFATAQLFPHYRARPIIQQGTGLYFFWACIIQTVWTLFFAMSWFILSFVAVVLALLCLVLLLASQHYNCLCAPTARGRDGMTLVGFLSSATVAPARQRRKSLLEYWFFRFPFYLHCGWLLVCMVVQFSMVFRYRFTHSSGAQLTADIVALGVLLPPATFFLTGQSSGPDFVIPIVIIWSYLSIAVELNQPSGTLVELYGHPAILAVQNASYIFAGIIGVMLVPRVVVWIAQEFCTIDVVELDDEANITTAIHEVRSGSGGGLFHRFSRRRADGGDDDAEETEPRMPLRDPLLVAENGDGSDDGLFSVRRRLIEEGGGECGEDPAVAGEEEGKDEERYEDCHETENANNREGPPTEAIETEDRA